MSSRRWCRWARRRSGSAESPAPQGTSATTAAGGGKDGRHSGSRLLAGTPPGARRRDARRIRHGKRRAHLAGGADPGLPAHRPPLPAGGASNVAASAAALGAQVSLCGVVGADAQAKHLCEALASAAPAVKFLAVEDPHRPTTVKTRFVSNGQHVLRVDTETATPIEPAIASAVMRELEPVIATADAVVVSDYAKGAIVESIFRTVIPAAKRAGKPVLVDPKRRDFGFYRGADYLTPNSK